MKMRPIILIPIISAFILGCSSSENYNSEVSNNSLNLEKPKNIVLLIGDGMGLSEISASLFFNDKASNFEKFTTVGLIKTSASDNLITDSAASATAFACGIKTYNGAIGVNEAKIAAPSIVENVSLANLSTGVISTSSITHATPASFYAHVDARGKAEEIAAFMPESDIDFFAGGGLKYFNAREDNRDLIAEMESKGFTIKTDNLQPSLTDKKLGFLLAEDGMPKMLDGRGNFLPTATEIGLEHLSKNKNGFFLMIEGSQIDWGGHQNNADYLISELIDFDETIGRVLDFADRYPETLVIVTADHETGGFTLSSDGSNYNKIQPTFSTGGHSATMVPVFAKGPGAELFGGVYENNEIFNKMMLLLSK